MAMKFVDAYKRLQEINSIIAHQDVVDIDSLLELQKEAESLYTFCKDKLSDTQIGNK